MKLIKILKQNINCDFGIFVSMSYKVLSKYLEDRSNDEDNPNTITVLSTLSSKYEVGQICIHEWYENNNSDKTFSYMKETAVITDVTYYPKLADKNYIRRYDNNNSYVERPNTGVIVITVNSASAIDYNLNIIHHKTIGLNLISFDDGKNWKSYIPQDGNPIDLDELFLMRSRCAHVALISYDDVIERYYVSDSVLKESDGKLHSSTQKIKFMDRPIWCVS